jgi:hypothetical protein
MPATLTAAQVQEAVSQGVKEGVSQGFATAPPRYPRFQLPRTISEWVRLLILSGALISGVSWLVVEVKTASDAAKRDYSPVAQMEMLSVQKDILELKQHSNVEGIHQTPSEKKLAMLESFEPFRSDVQRVENRVENLEIQIGGMVESLKEIKIAQKEMRETYLKNQN